MLISDVMKTNVISIPSTTSLAEARRIMDAHKIRRLPVIDNLKLVGIVTRDTLDKMGPSKLTTFSVHELVYMLNRITVKEVMHKDVVTVPPDTTIEESVSLAQSRRVGSLLIMENNRVIGIATTNDIFLNILNPLLGIGMPGSRMVVIDCHQGTDIERVLGVINRINIPITNLFLSEFPTAQKHDLIIHLAVADASAVAGEIEKLGFGVVIRKR
ncbi:MAG TPA: CBS domain-containing protein [Dehalococcoidales bacterium]|nr:CBS domain-containing protein [Dehalococcoidales bacterium]